MGIKKETITQLIIPDQATREILTWEVGNIKDVNLCNLLPLSIMPECQEDRGLVEELFTDGSSQDLVCTATLACVYLPADTLSAKESSLGATGNFLVNQ
jgi:hypothetical protein